MNWPNALKMMIYTEVIPKKPQQIGQPVMLCFVWPRVYLHSAKTIELITDIYRQTSLYLLKYMCASIIINYDKTKIYLNGLSVCY